MKKLFILTILLELTTLCYSQTIKTSQNKNRFGLGIEYSVYKEQNMTINNFDPYIITTELPAYDDIIPPLHSDFKPFIFYSLNDNSSIGLTYGFGQQKEDYYNWFYNQNWNFESQSSEFGFFYNYKLLSLFNNKLFLYGRPTVRYRIVRQMLTTYLGDGSDAEHGEAVVAGTNVISNQDITNYDLNFSLIIGYEFIKKTEIELYISNNSISREKIRENDRDLIAYNHPSDKWIFFDDFIFIGFGLNYRFN